MRIALLSNINSDLHNFVQVLDELSKNYSDIIRLVNLGDIVGHGQFTNQCLEIARSISPSKFNPEPIERKVISNNLSLGGIRDQDAIQRITEYLKQGVVLNTLIGRQDVASWRRAESTKRRKAPPKKIRWPNLYYLLWHQYPQRYEFIHCMKITQKHIPAAYNHLEVRFAYGSWTDSLKDQIESYKKITNMMMDSSESSMSEQNKVKNIQTIINRSFMEMDHWCSILFIGGAPEPTLFYKKREQSQTWFIYEVPLESNQEYLIENDHNYITTVGSVGKSTNDQDYNPCFTVLDLPEDRSRKPCFTMHQVTGQTE